MVFKSDQLSAPGAVPSDDVKPVVKVLLHKGGYTRADFDGGFGHLYILGVQVPRPRGVVSCGARPRPKDTVGNVGSSLAPVEAEEVFDSS